MLITSRHYYIPEYAWMIIKEFMLKKQHPTAKLLKTLSLRYLRPQIFMSDYFQLRDGRFMKVDKPMLQMMPHSLEETLTFNRYVRMKDMKKRFIDKIKMY